MSRYKLVPTRDKSRAPLMRWVLNIPRAISPSGKRERRVFNSEEAAKKAALAIRRRVDYWGQSANRLTPERMRDAHSAFEVLDRAKASDSLFHIVTEWVLSTSRDRASIPVGQLFDEYIEQRSKHQSAEHLEQLKYSKLRLKTFAEWKVSQLSTQDIEDALIGLPPSSYNRHLTRIRAVLQSAVRKGYASKNAAVGIDKRHEERGIIQVLPVERAERMLRYAERHKRALIPYLALGLFAGVRTREMTRMEWADISISDRRVLIRNEVSKTKRKRYITLEDNAVQWLRPYLGRKGRVLGRFTRQTLRTARRVMWHCVAGETDWPINALRHSYATYSVAKHRDVSELALNLGHSSSVTSFRHYADGATLEDATNYFNIYPISKLTGSHSASEAASQAEG